jgi:uncharacterized protein (DUF1778 family)
MAEATINIRASRADLGLIDSAAAIEGKTRSAFLRDCAQAAAMKVFKRPRLIGEPCPVCGALTAGH